MPTTATLRERRHARFCNLWLIDGIEYAFTDDPILSSGDFTGDGHDVRVYLDSDQAEVEEALDIRAGKLDEVSARMTLVDYDGILAQLFAAEDPAELPLEQSIYPGDSLVARTDVHLRHVGTEFIGSSGERGRFPCIPSFNFAQMHVGLDQQLPHHRAAPVTTTPIVWRGRRCALYRCYIDADGTRRPFTEAERLWWGTMADRGQVDGRRWTLEVSGPQSWLQKDLGGLTQGDVVSAIGAISLSSAAGQDETRIGVSFSLLGSSGSLSIYGSRSFAASITGLVLADVISDISAELVTASGTAGPDGAFDAANNRYVSIDSHGRITIHTDEDSGNMARMRLTLHRKVWQALGYDPIVQVASEGPEHVAFAWYDPGAGFDGLPSEGAPLGAAPAAGYITAVIDTGIPGDIWLGDNGGHPRQYVPLYPGGTSTLLAGLNNGAGQIVDLGDGFGSTIVYHRGQLSRPVASAEDDPTSPYTIPDAGACNRQGLWLFFGKRRYSSGAEFDEYWVARASWRSGALQEQGIVSFSRIVVTEWLSPRQFGYDRPLPTSDWVGRANAEPDYRIRCVPILALDYAAGDERAHVVIERLLRTTGTSDGWSSYSLDPAATLDGGDNDSAGTPHRDAEVEDLGLSIPDEMVANIISFGLEGDALPGDLGAVKVAFSPGMASDELLEGLMRPFGWAWSLRGGVYGLFTPTRTPSPEAIDFVLDGSTKLGGGGGSRFQQELRAFAPIDRFTLKYSWAPHVDKWSKDFAIDSKDVGRRYRPGGIDEDHRAHGMRRISEWSTKVRDMGVWWNRRHFFVRSWPYMDRRPCHVGEYVRITDPRGFDGAGVYGLDEMIGVVVAVRTQLRPGPRDPFSYLDVLVYAGTSGLPRLHAFVGRAFGIDTVNHRFYMRDNWLSIPHPAWPGDASYFVESTLPGLDALGGNADLSFAQWNGSSWRTPITGLTCTGIGSDANGDYLQLSGAPSEYFHKMDTIVFLTSAATQSAAWVLARYGVTCDQNGTFDSGGSAGYRWEDL